MLAADPPKPHIVNHPSLYYIRQPDLIAREYNAFLNTKATHDYGASKLSQCFSKYTGDTSPHFSWYFDSIFMTEKNDLSSIEEKTSGPDVDICIQRKLQKDQWVYSLIPGRENYYISYLNNQDALNELENWRKNPMAKEIRDYINNKIAETVTPHSVYTEAVLKIRDRYHQSSYNFEKLDDLVKGLTGDNSTRLQIKISFDANGRATSCLYDQEAARNLIYFDQIVGPEGDEAASDFASFISLNMNSCAHLYQGSDYYRPNEIHQTIISADPVPLPEMPSSIPVSSQPTDSDLTTRAPAN